jgi:hypothetical protein
MKIIKIILISLFFLSSVVVLEEMTYKILLLLTSYQNVYLSKLISTRENAYSGDKQQLILSLYNQRKTIFGIY